MPQLPNAGSGAYIDPPQQPTFFDIVDEFRDAQRGFWELEHFIGNPPDADKSGNVSMKTAKTVDGAVLAAATTPPVGAYGCATCQIPVNLGGGNDSANLFSQQVVVLANDFVGRFAFMVRHHIDVLPGAADDSQIILGVGDLETNFGEPSDGWYWHLDDTLGSNWILKSARASARTVANSGFAPIAGVWQTLALIADVGSGCVDMFAANDGDPLVQVGRMLVPVNLQPAVSITPIVGLSSAGGIRANAQKQHLDYVGYGADYGTFR